MKLVWVVIAGVVVIASDFFVDFPGWLLLPEFWDCGGIRQGGFEFCRAGEYQPFGY